MARETRELPFRDPTISRCEFLRRLCAHCALRLLGLRFKRHEVLWRREVCFRVLTPRTPPAANKCVSRPPPHLASPRESLRVTRPTRRSFASNRPPLALSVPGRPGQRPLGASGGRPHWTAACRGSCWTRRRRRGALARDVLEASLGPRELCIDEVLPALDVVPVL